MMTQHPKHFVCGSPRALPHWYALQYALSAWALWHTAGLSVMLTAPTPAGPCYLAGRTGPPASDSIRP